MTTRHIFKNLRDLSRDIKFCCKNQVHPVGTNDTIDDTKDNMKDNTADDMKDSVNCTE
jgi:hypothetical protein